MPTAAGQSCLLAIVLLVSPHAVPGQRGRYAPPAAVECDRNKLTSYIGRVVRYTRKDSGFALP
ncbi:MAG: hypothetical protein JNN08_16145 [Bryobacterales bacterium]|nr:hypothetical protein [Bryobacterales bacterium]